MTTPLRLNYDAILQMLAPQVSNIAQRILNARLLPQIAALADIEEERMEQLNQGAVPGVQELLALNSAIFFLWQNEQNEVLDELYDLTEKITWVFLNTQYEEITRQICFLQSLVNASGAPDQDQFLSTYHLFMDASVLCSEAMPLFLDNLLPAIEALPTRLKITVPQGVVRSLQELSSDPAQADLTGAGNGMRQLKRIQAAGLLSVRGDENDSTIMSTFISAFSRFKPTNALALLTEDEAIANAVNTLNNIGIEGSDILTAHLNQDGTVCLWFEDTALLPEDEAVLLAPDEEPVAEHERQEVLCESAADENCHTASVEEAVSAIIPEFLHSVLPMDAPLEDEDTRVPQDEASGCRFEDDDLDDDELVTDESELEKFLMISSMLDVDDEEEQPTLIEIQSEASSDDERQTDDVLDPESESNGSHSEIADSDVPLVPIVPASDSADSFGDLTEMLRVGDLIEEDNPDTDSDGDDNIWESLE